VPKAVGTVTMSNRLPHKIIAALLTAGASAGLTASCAPNDSALFIRGVLARVSPQCSVKADPSSLMLGIGTLDRAFASSYIAPLLVGNQLVRRGAKDQLRTETSRVRLEGAIVSVGTASGATLQEFSTIGTGFVDPGTGDEPGYGFMYATLVPPGVGTAGDVVNVTVRVYGTTLGGEEIESGDISFPVQICQGCLVSYEYADPVTGQCILGNDVPPEHPCVVGQYELVDCRLCAQQYQICLSP